MAPMMVSTLMVFLMVYGYLEDHSTDRKWLVTKVGKCPISEVIPCLPFGNLISMGNDNFQRINQL